MLVAIWNLNNLFGKVKFRPEAADAAIALNADVLVFNEYLPQKQEATINRTLHEAGWTHQSISVDTGEKANRIFIASRHQLHRLEIRLPGFDRQFPSNVLCVCMPEFNISIVGIRIP